MALADAKRVLSYAILTASKVWRYRLKVSMATNNTIGSKIPINKLRRRLVCRTSRMAYSALSK